MVPRLLRPAFNWLTFGFQPMYWVGVAVSVGASLIGSSASKKAGKEAAKEAQRQWDIEQEMKLGAVKAQTEQIILSKNQAFEKAAQTMSDMSRQAMMARGKLAAASGEAGVAGISVASIFMASFYEEAMARGQEIHNLENYNQQANAEIRGVQSGLMLGSKPSKYDSTGDTMKFVADSLAIVGTKLMS